MMHVTDMDKPLPYDTKKRRTAQWYQTMIRTGRAHFCPYCGNWTRSESGVCKPCQKRWNE